MALVACVPWKGGQPRWELIGHLAPHTPHTPLAGLTFGEAPSGITKLFSLSGCFAEIVCCMLAICLMYCMTCLTCPSQYGWSMLTLGTFGLSLCQNVVALLSTFSLCVNHAYHAQAHLRDSYYLCLSASE